MRSLYIISEEEFDFNILNQLEGWTIITDRKRLKKLGGHESIFVMENEEENVRIFFSKCYGCYRSVNALPILIGDKGVYKQSYDWYNNKPLLEISDDILYSLCININKTLLQNIEAVCTIVP